jgi:hypothetical protein
MSTTRNHGDLVFECDRCHDTLESNDSDFGIAWSMAKREGWTVKKVFNEWQHTCPNCEMEHA